LPKFVQILPKPNFAQIDLNFAQKNFQVDAAAYQLLQHCVYPIDSFPFLSRANAKGVFFQGGGGGADRKLAKKYRKIVLFASSRGEGQRKKNRKNSKKG